MKKKIICLIGIVVIVLILLICTIAYFRPLSFPTVASENCKIYVTLNETGYVVDDPGIHMESYEDLTDKQKSDILSVLEEYPYQRNLGTPFSDGAIHGTGGKILQIFIAPSSIEPSSIAHSLPGLLTVTSSGKINVDGKNYTMENSEQFIEQILAIVRSAE